MKIGITGSLSSGKSSVANIISGNKNLLFSADKVVQDLYSNDQFKKKIKKKNLRLKIKMLKMKLRPNC